MFRYTVDAAKGLFFDSRTVEKAASRAERRALSKFGAFVRTGARGSIRTSKDGKASAPGRPPKSHTGRIKKFIFFAYDPDRRSVVIGPAKFAGAISDLGALESGGVSTRVVERGGKKVRRKARYTARPFMVPAFTKQLPKVPQMWRDAIHT